MGSTGGGEGRVTRELGTKGSSMALGSTRVERETASRGTGKTTSFTATESTSGVTDGNTKATTSQTADMATESSIGLTGVCGEAGGWLENSMEKGYLLARKGRKERATGIMESFYRGMCCKQYNNHTVSLIIHFHLPRPR